MIEEIWQETPGESKKCTGIAKLSNEKKKRVDKNAHTLTYFHYRLHRFDVEALIREDGDFILRVGTRHDKDGYTISVRWGGRLLHFPIFWVNEACCFEDEQFELIQNLVHHHVTTKAPVTKKTGAILHRARARQPWELMTGRLEQGRKLGSGSFGVVYEAKWTRPDKVVVSVAVKTLEKPAAAGATWDAEQLIKARDEMLLEARIMRELSGHPNIVKAYGVTIDKENPSAVVELMNGGTLHQRLRNKQKSSLSLMSKLKVLLEIARGMSYVNRSGFVHRDLATRNVLLNMAPDDEVGVAKITDFGLARKLKNKRFIPDPLKDTEQFPVKWTAYEGVISKEWHELSDVWSLGVVMWEVFTNAAEPYFYMEDADNVDTFMTLIREGGRLEMSHCIDASPAMQSLMQQCWNGVSDMRPPLFYVCWELEDMLRDVIVKSEKP